MGGGQSGQQRPEWAVHTLVSQGSAQGIRPSMEDFHITSHLRQHKYISFFAIYDGHGGKNTARHLSENLHHNIDRAWVFSYAGASNDKQFAARKAAANSDHIWPLLTHAVEEAFLETDKEAVWRNQLNFDDSGCTAAVILLDQAKGRLFAANTGDAQTLLNRNGQAISLVKLHKPDAPEEKERIEQAGHIVMNGRLDGRLAVSRAFGDRSFKVEDRKEGGSEGPTVRVGQNEALTAFPFSVQMDLNPLDKYVVLACDGLFDVLSPQDVVDWVDRKLLIYSKDEEGKKLSADEVSAKARFGVSNSNAKRIARDLCDYAIDTKRSKDNVSIVIVFLAWNRGNIGHMAVNANANAHDNVIPAQLAPAPVQPAAANGANGAGLDAQSPSPSPVVRMHVAPSLAAEAIPGAVGPPQ